MLFPNKDVAQKKEAIENIIDESHPSKIYFFLLSLSAAISTFGIILNSEAIIIGGMLIGPFLAPLMALSLGIATLSPKAALKATLNSLLSILIIIGISSTLGFWLGERTPIEQIINWGDFTYLYLAVALFSGAASAYLWIRPKKSSSQAGVAVSISIVPPLCLVGLALSISQFYLASEALKIFGINVLGIILSATIVFVFMDLFKYRDVQEKEIKQMDEKEKKKEQVEKIV